MNNYLTKKVVYFTYQQFLNELEELKKNITLLDTLSSHKKMLQMFSWSKNRGGAEKYGIC